MTQPNGMDNGTKLVGQRKRRKRLWFGLAAVLVIGIGALLAVFASGPVTVPLLGTLLASQGTRGPVTLSVESASVDFTDPKGIKLVVTGADVEIAGATPVSIRLPRLEAPINRAALGSGNVHFASIRAHDPVVSITLSGGPAVVPQLEPLLEAVDRIADLVDDQFARRALQAVQIRNGEFEINGPASRKFRRIDVDIHRDADRTITAVAKVDGRLSPWRIDMLRTAPLDGTFKTMGVVVNGITIGELLAPEAPLAYGKGLRLPASAKIEARLSHDGTFDEAKAVARIGNGWLQMGRTLVAFDDVALALNFLGKGKPIEIAKSHFIRGNTRVFFTGRIGPPEDGGDWSFRLDSKHPQFGASDVLEPVQMLDGILVRGTFDPAERLATINQFTARSGKAVVHGVASVQVTSDGPYLAVAADGEKLPVALVKQVWPITLVPPARKWVIERLKGGRIDTLSYTGAVRPPAFNYRDPDSGWSGDDMAAKMAFSDGSVQPVGDVPVVSGLSGTVTVENEVMTVSASRGTTEVADGGEVEVPQTVFRIENLPLRFGKVASITTRLEGENADLGMLMNSAPFFVLDKAGLKKGGVTGSGTVDIKATFPLEKVIDPKSVVWQATGQSSDFSDANEIMGHTIQSADIVFEADRNSVAVTGNGVFDGIEADINLVIPLGDNGGETQQDVVATLTVEQLKARGIDLSAFLKGEMRISSAKTDGGQDIDIDLTQSEVRLSAMGWEKASGVPATASFGLRADGTENRIQDFSLVTEGADIFGQIRLSEKGELIEAQFDRFQLRPGDSAEVDIRTADGGRYDIIFSGKAFDGRGLIRSLQSPGGSKGAGDFAGGARIAVNLDRITGFNNRWIQNLSGKIDTGPNGLLAADLNGQIDGRSEFKFTLADRDGAQLATGRFEDTGGTLAFLDLYERMQGGRGTLDVVLADEDSWVGEFAVRSLVIAEDPAIRQIRERDRRLSASPGDLAKGTTPAGSASFDTLDINFSRESDAIIVSRGALRGAVLGGTVSGTVDLAQQTLNMTGTFVPIYALNNFFSKIPLLGFALGGGTGEGLIGVTYRLSGALNDPVLSVNPISAIAPGIFRKMFEFQPN